MKNELKFTGISIYCMYVVLAAVSCLLPYLSEWKDILTGCENSSYYLNILASSTILVSFLKSKKIKNKKSSSFGIMFVLNVLCNSTILCAQESASDEVPMPTYFRFLALLAFKIFAAEQVLSLS